MFDALALDLTPLGVAAIRAVPNVIEFLFTKGADVNAKDSSGATPLAIIGIDVPVIRENPSCT